jgi:antitoxin ParD1/3/4
MPSSVDLAAIARGLADGEAGRVKPLGTVFDRLDAKFRTMAKPKAR